LASVEEFHLGVGNSGRITYLDLLENYLMPQLQQQYMARGFIFQQDGVAPHFHRQVTASLSLSLVF